MSPFPFEPTGAQLELRTCPECFRQVAHVEVRVRASFFTKPVRVPVLHCPKCGGASPELEKLPRAEDSYVHVEGHRCRGKRKAAVQALPARKTRQRPA